MASWDSVIDGKRVRQLAPSYALDWLVIILSVALFFLMELITPFQREFSVNDKTISYPYAIKETVNTVELFVICFITPLVLISAIAIGYSRSGFDWHQGVLGLALSLALALGITDLIKVTTGRLRPDFLDRCQPVNSTQDPEFGLLTISATCHQTNTYILDDGSKSFPSGHSSLSFAGLGFLSWYCAGKLRLMDQRGRTIKAFLVLIPLAGAALVAISRVDDYRHHWEDVVTGSVLGFLTAWFAYRQYYPPLRAEKCWKPYSPRIQRKRVEEDGLGLGSAERTEQEVVANGGREEEVAMDLAMGSPV